MPKNKKKHKKHYPHPHPPNQHKTEIDRLQKILNLSQDIAKTEKELEVMREIHGTDDQIESFIDDLLEIMQYGQMLNSAQPNFLCTRSNPTTHELYLDLKAMIVRKHIIKLTINKKKRDSR
jgi:hypothetical protein